MLDENLPTFYFKPSSDNPQSTTVFLSENGSELAPEYTLRRPDPRLPASQNCYAVALYDSHNAEVLFAEVLVQPEWQQPTLSSSEIRAQNGIAPPPVPIVPEKFVVQLYNPDQQVLVKQIAGSWNSSAHWEFEMPQTTFRQPSAAAIDRVQNDPTISEATPKVTFKWKRDGKLSNNISCFMAGKSTDGRKQREPDILCAMTKGGNLTLYQPNMHRVDIEDAKGLEVVLLLSSSVIKDIYFQPNKEMFNINSASMPHAKRKNSGPVIGGKPTPPGSANNTPPVMSGGYIPPPPPPLSQYPQQPVRPQQHQQNANISRPPPGSTNPPFDPRKQWEIDAETARLKRLVEEEEKERAKQEAREQKKIKKMLEQEEKERARREAEVAKETERLRRQYGMPPQQQQQSPPRVSFSAAPPMPPRPNQNSFQPPPGRLNGLNQYQSAPHSQPTPVQRPLSTPNGLGTQHHNGSTISGFNLSSLNNLLHNGVSAVASHAHGGSGSNKPPKPTGSPYLQAPGQGTASSSGFFGLGGKNKIQKKRSVYF